MAEIPHRTAPTRPSHPATASPGSQSVPAPALAKPYSRLPIEPPQSDGTKARPRGKAARSLVSFPCWSSPWTQSPMICLPDHKGRTRRRASTPPERRATHQIPRQSPRNDARSPQIAGMRSNQVLQYCRNQCCDDAGFCSPDPNHGGLEIDGDGTDCQDLGDPGSGVGEREGEDLILRLRSSTSWRLRIRRDISLCVVTASDVPQGSAWAARNCETGLIETCSGSAANPESDSQFGLIGVCALHGRRILRAQTEIRAQAGFG